MISLKTIIQNKGIRWAIAIAWTVFLSILLLQPENQPIIPTGVQPAPPSLSRELLFSSVHIITMSVTAILWAFALNIQIKNYRLMALIIVLINFGLGVEYLQGSIPGRTAQWWDMLANVIGICVGLCLWIVAKQKSKSHKLTLIN